MRGFDMNSTAVRRLCIVAVGLSLVVPVGHGAHASTSNTSTTSPRAIVGTARDGKPESPAEGREAIDGAVAGVLVGALTEQFGGRAIAIKLDTVSVLPSSIRDRLVSGNGRLQIGADEEWIGFRFSTLYDTDVGNASYPQITLGGVTTDEHEIPNDTTLVSELDNNVVGRLGVEFANQNVRLQLDRIITVEAGTRYLRISASGIADFGRDGTTPAQVEALYDRHDNAWLRVNYELGSTANREGEGVIAGS